MSNFGSRPAQPGVYPGLIIVNLKQDEQDRYAGLLTLELLYDLHPFLTSLKLLLLGDPYSTQGRLPTDSFPINFEVRPVNEQIRRLLGDCLSHRIRSFLAHLFILLILAGLTSLPQSR